MPTWIKFCGTTCLEDALASIEAGADALGFIFAPSRRQITPAKAHEIIGKLPAHVETIGVFQNATIEQIHKTVAEVDLTGIQLHGNEFAPEVYSYLPKDRRDSLRIIKTIIVYDSFGANVDEGQMDIGLADMTNVVPNVIGAWLLDSGAGSGKTFDWKSLRLRLENWKKSAHWKFATETLGERPTRIIIAGGLNPENVGEAVTMFSPWGVDVVSGIEREPGRKDPAKMRAFVSAVRKAEQR